jgi:hypothetical protein
MLQDTVSTSSTHNMAFKILPCTLDDMPAVSHVLIEAHRSDPIVSLLLPRSAISPATELAFWTACHVAEFAKPGRLFFKLVDTETRWGSSALPRD